jgi:hypothetical protein
MIQQQTQELIKPTWLYIKQHTVTGLKYFGKTTRNPEKYKGSGKRWVNHLAIHGNIVKTVWSQLFTSKPELVEFALNFSKENNIVESNEWANLMPENGLDGGSPKGTNKGRPCSDQARQNLDNSRKNRIYTPMSKESKEKLRNSKLGKQITFETREKLKLARAKQLASNDIRFTIICPNNDSYNFNRLEIRQFCQSHNLTYASLLAKGKQGKLYKGYRAIKIPV